MVSPQADAIGVGDSAVHKALVTGGDATTLRPVTWRLSWDTVAAIRGTTPTQVTVVGRGAGTVSVIAPTAADTFATGAGLLFVR